MHVAKQASFSFMTSVDDLSTLRLQPHNRFAKNNGWPILGALMLLLFMQSAGANPKSLSRWVEYFTDKGQSIFFSSDYLSSDILSQSLYLTHETLDDFKDELASLDLQLIAVDESVWVIQTVHKIASFITVIKAVDAGNENNINYFQLTTAEGITQISNQAAIILDSSQLTDKPLTVTANGYYPDTEVITVQSQQNNLLTIRLQPLPLALSDIKVSTSQLYFDNQVNSQYHLNREDLARQVVFNNDPLRSGERLSSHITTGFNGRAHVRGGQLNETYIELDGMALRNPYHFKDFAALFSTINPVVVNSVSHYSGVFPAQYGGRLSSVMSVNSDSDGRDLQQTTDISLLTFSHTGRQNTDQQELLWSVRTGGQLIGSSLLPHLTIEPEFEDGYFKFKQYFAPHWSSSQHFLVSRDELNIQQTEEQAYAAYHDQYAWLQFHYDSFASHQSQWQVAFSRHHNQRNGRINDTWSTGLLNEDLLSRHLSVNWDHQWQINSIFEFSLGASLKQSKADLWSQRISHHDPFWADLLKVATSNHRNYQNTADGLYWSYYSNIRWQWHDHWIADIGFYNEQAQWLPHQGFSPRLNIAYLPNSIHQWRFGLGRHQQAQRIDELLYADKQPVYQQASSADIAVIDYQYYLNKNYRFRVEAYFKKYSNTLPYYENLFSDFHLLPELYADYQRIVPDDARARGIELSIQGQYQQLTWSASYILADVVDEIDNREIPRSWQQRHTLKTTLSVPLGKWQLDLALQQHSGWPSTQIIMVGDELAVTERNSQNHNDFFQLDANLSRQWQASYGRWRLQLQLQNALNINNPCCNEYNYTDNTLSSKTRSFYPLVPNIRWTLDW